MRRIIEWALVGVAALWVGSAPAAGPAVPVEVGGDQEFPACEGKGVLNDREAINGRVEVRSGPTGTFRVLDRLPVETEVYMCDENSTFVGIIYGDGGCGLTEAIERRSAYRGSCSSGWVHNQSVDPWPLSPS